MVSRYYTPEIEEFHVGFEYEQASSKIVAPKQWHKEKFYLNGSHIDIVKYSELDLNVRVKYLDKEDIESLGFELDQCTKDGCVFYKGNLITKEEWCLTFGGKTNPKNYLSIHSLKNNPNSFTGTIKNKSELKKLLKMLGIL